MTPSTTTTSITTRQVVCLGISQIVSWGTLHYLMAAFGTAMAKDLGWSQPRVYAGFTCALLVMGLISSHVGRWFDLHGGRWAMTAGNLIGAAGCLALASASGEIAYFAGWAMLGVAMRLTLYDAAFAALARVGGASARPAMAKITLFGGLASTLFWPLGQAFAQAWGWRGALACYAAILVLTCLLYRCLPVEGRPLSGPVVKDAGAPGIVPIEQRADLLMFGLIATLILCLQTAMASHLIALIESLGWSTAEAVRVAMLLGIGQVLGRVTVVTFLGGADPLRLNLLPAGLLLVSFTTAAWVGDHALGGALFTFFYGAGNGIATITRGAIPLRLFDPQKYGSISGWVLRPAFVVSALAPAGFAWIATQHGYAVGIRLAIAVAAAVLILSVGLMLHSRR